MSLTRWSFAIGVLLWSMGAAAQSWRAVPLTAPAYDYETQDFGVPPTNTIRTGDYDAPTPTAIAGATVVTTPRLRDMMVAPRPPVLIDVIGGSPTATLPGAVWLPGAGFGSSLNDTLQQRLAAPLADLTGGDKTKPIVFFCLSRTCWLSHNAVLRALALGYRNVFWYRGGHRAWAAAGLAMGPVRAISF